MRAMPMDKKNRWKLQIFWCGDWRTIMESDDRHILMEYAQTCAEDTKLKILDTSEEVSKRDRRH
jgi:hypothetical protein